MKWGDMLIEFTVGDPDSVRLRVQAMVADEAALDKLIAALEASRQLLPASGIEAATADETRSGSAVGESPAPEGGDAQKEADQ